MITSSLMMLGLVLLRLGSFMAATPIPNLQLRRAAITDVQIPHSLPLHKPSPREGRLHLHLEAPGSLAPTAAEL